MAAPTVTAIDIRHSEIEETCKNLISVGHSAEADRLQDARRAAAPGSRRFDYTPSADNERAFLDALRTARRNLWIRRLTIIVGIGSLVGLVLAIWPKPGPPPKTVGELAKPSLQQLDDANRNLSTALDELTTDEDTAKMVRLTGDTALEILGQADSQIGSLEPADADQALHQKMLSALAAERTYLESVAALIRNDATKRQQRSFAADVVRLQKLIDALTFDFVGSEAITGAVNLAQWLQNRTGDEAAVNAFPPAQQAQARQQIPPSSGDTAGGVGIRVTPERLRCNAEGCDHRVRIESTGRRQLEIRDVRFDGPGAAQFAGGEPCENQPVYRETPCEFAVDFTPTGREETATLVIHQNLQGPPTVVRLEGSGQPVATTGDLAFTGVSSCTFTPATGLHLELTVSAPEGTETVPARVSLGRAVLLESTSVSPGEGVAVDVALADAPTRPVTVTLDPEGLLAESDEENNALQLDCAA